MFHIYFCRLKKPRTKILFYIVKHGPNNTKIVKLMNQKGKKRKDVTTSEVNDILVFQIKELPACLD